MKVYCPVVTPFNRDLSTNPQMLAQQCQWLLSQGVGLAPFGTTSEGNSLSVDEKIDLLDSLIDAGIDAEQMIPGTGASAFPDTVRLTQHATNLGCKGVLMLPPFYYKGVTDEGLFRSYSEVIQRVGDSRLRIYLYHHSSCFADCPHHSIDSAPARDLSGHDFRNQGFIGRLGEHERLSG